MTSAASAAAPAGAEAMDAEEAMPQAHPLGFSAKAEPSQVGLGRPFVYEIEVRHDVADSYELPQPLELGEAAVRKVESTREEQAGEATTRFRIEAALFDHLGDAALPDLVLVAKGPDGPRELRIPGAPVTVIASTQGDELAGMHPPQELRVPSYAAIWVALGFLLAAALAFIGYRQWVSRRRRRGEAAAPERSAEERALEALALLEAESLPAGGLVREHYFRLSSILRSFIEESGGPEALERTSAELVAALRKTPLAGLEPSSFERWLERGDLVRYAGVRVALREASSDLAEARSFVVGVADTARARAEQDAAALAASGAATAGATTADAVGGAAASAVRTSGIPASGATVRDLGDPVRPGIAVVEDLITVGKQVDGPIARPMRAEVVSVDTVGKGGAGGKGERR